jgi:N-formylglutamate amidohydrolase
MIDVYGFHEGDAPLLISVPHDGIHLPPEILERMTPRGAAVPDTDWHVAELYGFARELGANMLVANYSRYVVDLNRPPDDTALYEGHVATGLCPLQTFTGDDIYATDPVEGPEVRERIESYWRPYHDRIAATLAALREKHGYALLWDAHSIASVVPRLFDGELPALNLGTDGGGSCAPGIEKQVTGAAASSGYSYVLNGRFRGGYITRRYGDPENRVHALQLEIAQRVYMDETTTVFDVTKADSLRATLRTLLEAFLETAREQ